MNDGGREKVVLTKEIYDLSLQSQSKQTELTACEEDIIAAEKELETAYKKLEMDIKRRSVSAISSKIVFMLCYQYSRIG